MSQILARMAEAGFSSDEVVALLASHSIAAQDEIEPEPIRFVHLRLDTLN